MKNLRSLTGLVFVGVYVLALLLLVILSRGVCNASTGDIICDLAAIVEGVPVFLFYFLYDLIGNAIWWVAPLLACISLYVLGVLMDMIFVRRS